MCNKSLIYKNKLEQILLSAYICKSHLHHRILHKGICLCFYFLLLFPSENKLVRISQGFGFPAVRVSSGGFALPIAYPPVGSPLSSITHRSAFFIVPSAPPLLHLPHPLRGCPVMSRGGGLAAGRYKWPGSRGLISQ